MPNKTPLYIDPDKMQAEYDEHVAAIRMIEADAERYGVTLHKAALPNDETALSSMSIRDAVYAVLQKEGAPMHLSAIYEDLIAAGVHIKGNSPKNTLFGTIRGDTDRFVNLGKNVWDLVERRGENGNTEGVEEANQ